MQQERHRGQGYNQQKRADGNFAALESVKVVLADSPPEVQVNMQRQLVEHHDE